MGKLTGVYVVLVTPFTKKGDVDCGGLRGNVEWLVEQGVDGVIPLGSTGEFASLDDDQARRVSETVLETVNGRVPVVVGAGAETTEKAIQNVKQASVLGASGVLVIPPWYYTPDAEELVHHYTRIGEASDIPVMIYNNPFTSKVDIEPLVLARLADVENIDCVKESSGNIRRLAEIRTLTDDGLAIFCGWEDMAYESFMMGAVGWVCVIGNVVPHMAVRLHDLVRKDRDIEAAWDLYKRMLPLLRYLEYEGKTQKALKYMLGKLGLCGGASSSPKLPLSRDDEVKLDRLMTTLNVGAE